MSDATLREIDFGRHHQRLARRLGTELTLAACDAQGIPVWTSDPEPQADTSKPQADTAEPVASTAGAIARLNEAGFVWEADGGGYKHQLLDGGEEILCAPIGDGAKTLGWIALLDQGARLECVAAGLPGVVHALRDTADAMHEEHLLRYELNFLAGELSERYEELHLVYSIDAHLKRTSGGRDAFDGLVELCARHLNADLAVLLNPSDKLTVWAGNADKSIFNLDLVLAEMRGDLWRFLQAGKDGVVINDEADPRRGYIFTDMPYKVLACPLFQNDSVAAMLVLVKHIRKPDFTASDRKLAEVMANQFGNLMDLCRAVEEMKTFTHQMAAALIETVEAKDPYTRGHSERVQSISLDIGRAMGLTPTELDALAWGSVLHDVGKIGVPDAVLCKPGPLTADEYTFVKVHSERGCEILNHIERLRYVVPILRHHHERPDGKGYPAGLSGKDIPIQSRIIAVADTYDAMTSSRAYRAGRTHEQAVQEILRVRGSQLDAEAVDAFLAVCAGTPKWIHDFAIRRAPAEPAPGALPAPARSASANG